MSALPNRIRPGAGGPTPRPVALVPPGGRHVDISLTSLVDVVSKSGTPKATCVKQIKAQLTAPYDPRNDYYKILREGIADIHAAGQPKTALSAIVGRVGDPKRAGTYASLVADYASWWGRKNIGWFAPPRSIWTPPGSGIGITVNPELGLDINGVRHVVKLYFKSEPLTKARIEVITHLMHQEFAAGANAGTQFSVLDMRRKKLHNVQPPSVVGPILVAEVAYIDSLWDHV